MTVRRALAGLACCASLNASATWPGALATPPDDESSRVLAALNRLRTDPPAAVPSLEELARHFIGTGLHQEHGPVLVTVEGAAAVREAIDYLTTDRTCPALRWSDVLAAAAADHVRAQSESGAIGHTGAGGDTVVERVARHGSWEQKLAENIIYGSQSPERFALDTVIDDGVPDRGHRRTLFDCALREVGIACAPHPSYRRACVMVFAAGSAPHRPRSSSSPRPD